MTLVVYLLAAYVCAVLMDWFGDICTQCIARRARRKL